MKEKTELPALLLQHIPWENGGNPIWPASSFILRRNLSKYCFPPKSSTVQAAQVHDILKTAILNCPEFNQPLLLKAEDVAPLDKEFLFEHFLCLESFQNTLASQSFVVDNTAHILALLNMQDHLQLQLVDCKGDWEDAWNRLSKIEMSIGGALEYAFSPKFGYLTSDPINCGTGLVVLVFLHVPALIHCKQLEDALLKQKEEGVVATDMQGAVETFIGDILVLRNQYTLGLTEDNILHALHATAMKLMVSEQALRTHLKQDNNAEIKDQISRAYGLLLHSYQLQTKEALSALSLLKLGLDLGWLGGLTDHKLNEVFFRCRRAHLAYACQEKAADAQVMPRKRAEYLHKELQGLQLKI